LTTVGFEYLELRRDDERASVWITLDRPAKKTALSIALRDEISTALEPLASDESIKSVVFTGRGDVFCAGFDLSEFSAAAGDDALERRLWDSSDRYHRAVLTFPLPTIAAVNGAALAGGMDLAVMCDLRYASATARFSHPEFRFGDVVYGPLHDLVGGAVARELCLTGRAVDAQEAKAVHLVNEVVATDQLVARVSEITAMINEAPRANLARTKAKALARAATARDATLDL
jgi:enoyl-CoA hydratase/carnithine racemase